jgi:hypothetical protein
MHRAFILANTEEYTFPALCLDNTLSVKITTMTITIALTVAMIPAQRRGECSPYRICG